MFYLTRQERLLVVFLAAALAGGAVVRAVRGRPTPHPRPPLQMEIDLSRPKTPAARGGNVSLTTTETPDGTIDVNTASAEELCRLPGVGPILADRIIQYRQRHGPFNKPSDLKRVTGIGAAKLREIEPYVRCGAPDDGAGPKGNPPSSRP